MNFFKTVVSFFKSPLARKIEKLGLDILKAIIGDAANRLQTIVREEVAVAEDARRAGFTNDKYTTVFKAVSARFPNLAESEINLAIELAVSALKREQTQ